MTLHYTKILSFLTFIILASVVTAEEEEWNTYLDCVDSNKSDVASGIVSLNEGSSLLVQVLCMDESAATARAMLQARPNILADNNHNFSLAFQSVMAVVDRETRRVLYREKLSQR